MYGADKADACTLHVDANGRAGAEPKKFCAGRLVKSFFEAQTTRVVGVVELHPSLPTEAAKLSFFSANDKDTCLRGEQATIVVLLGHLKRFEPFK